MELSILCKSQVHLYIFDEHEQLFEYCSHPPDMLLQKYVDAASKPHERLTSTDYDRFLISDSASKVSTTNKQRNNKYQVDNQEKDDYGGSEEDDNSYNQASNILSNGGEFQPNGGDNITALTPQTEEAIKYIQTGFPLPSLFQTSGSNVPIDQDRNQQLYRTNQNAFVKEHSNQTPSSRKRKTSAVDADVSQKYAVTVDDIKKGHIRDKGKLLVNDDKDSPPSRNVMKNKGPSSKKAKNLYVEIPESSRHNSLIVESGPLNNPTADNHYFNGDIKDEDHGSSFNQSKTNMDRWQQQSQQPTISNGINNILPLISSTTSSSGFSRNNNNNDPGSISVNSFFNHQLNFNSTPTVITPAATPGLILLSNLSPTIEENGKTTNWLTPSPSSTTNNGNLDDRIFDKK